MENVKDLLKDDRVKIFEAGGDITQIDLLDSVLKNTDGVFHFAAYGFYNVACIHVQHSKQMLKVCLTF